MKNVLEKFKEKILNNRKMAVALLVALLILPLGITGFVKRDEISSRLGMSASTVPVISGNVGCSISGPSSVVDFRPTSFTATWTNNYPYYTPNLGVSYSPTIDGVSVSPLPSPMPPSWQTLSTAGLRRSGTTATLNFYFTPSAYGTYKIVCGMGNTFTGTGGTNTRCGGDPIYFAPYCIGNTPPFKLTVCKVCSDFNDQMQSLANVFGQEAATAPTYATVDENMFESEIGNQMIGPLNSTCGDPDITDAFRVICNTEAQSILGPMLGTVAREYVRRRGNAVLGPIVNNYIDRIPSQLFYTGGGNFTRAINASSESGFTSNVKFGKTIGVSGTYSLSGTVKETVRSITLGVGLNACILPSDKTASRHDPVSVSITGAVTNGQNSFGVTAAYDGEYTALATLILRR